MLDKSYKNQKLHLKKYLLIMNYQWEMLEIREGRGYNKLICEMLTEASHRAVRPNNERSHFNHGIC